MGFTLAEVLITLGVIGVVAAMTIPTLFANYQKKVYVTQLKKAYSVANQALLKLEVDMGCTGDLQCTGLFGTNYIISSQKFGDEFVKQFKISNNCQLTSEKSCWSTDQSQNYNRIGSGGFDGNSDPSLYRFTTADGQAFAILAYDGGNCEQHDSSCGELRIDVNGPNKGPNNWGRDIFIFEILSKKGIVAPQLPDDTFCSAANPEGVFCAARIMNEGWEMNYDNPPYIAPAPPPAST